MIRGIPCGPGGSGRSLHLVLLMRESVSGVIPPADSLFYMAANSSERHSGGGLGLWNMISLAGAFSFSILVLLNDKAVYDLHLSDPRIEKTCKG